MRRARRARAVAAAVAGVAAVGAVAWLAPDAVREMDAFRVRQVVVQGTRFVEPYAVVQAAGLGPGSSVFDRSRVWRAGVAALPLVDEVRVRRTLPGTVHIDVREVEPVALLAGAALRPVSADGRLLEIEPAGAVLDLPILVDGAGAAEDGEPGDGARSAARMLASLAAEHGAVADRLSQVEVAGGWLRLVFRDDGPDALLPLEPTSTQLMQLRLALADLAARGELTSARRIDVRFRDQVVVSFQRRPVSG